MKTHHHPRPEKRKSKDIIRKYINICIGSSWLLFSLSAVLIYLAKPGYYFDRTLESGNPYGWNNTLASWSCFFIFLCFLSSSAGLYFNSKRMNRKGDAYSMSLILLALVSLSSVIGYFVKF